MADGSKKRFSSATGVQKASEPGYWKDENSVGLYLKIRELPSKEEGGKSRLSKNWIFRFRSPTTNKLRDMGLGSASDFSLAEARETATRARKLVHGGIDPITARESERAARRSKTANMLTFDQCTEKYINTMVQPKSKNPKHVAQWRSTMQAYASPVMGDLPVNMVADHHVLAILEPIWTSKTVTATRVQQRIAKILGWAKAKKLRSGENPARWTDHLKEVLPDPNEIKMVQHQPSLPYSRMYEFMQELATHNGAAARCLELTILCAVRTKESTGAKWSEVDFKNRTWTVPSERLKVKIDKATKKPRIHRVPLSDATIDVLKAQEGHDETYIFPGTKGAHISDMAMLMLLRDMGEYKDEDGRDIVTHGFRSTFRTWAAESTNAAHDICEAALAHTVKNKVSAAYQHSDLLEKRRALMNAWATHAIVKTGGSVAQFKAG